MVACSGDLERTLGQALAFDFAEIGVIGILLRWLGLVLEQRLALAQMCTDIEQATRGQDDGAFDQCRFGRTILGQDEGTVT